MQRTVIEDLKYYKKELNRVDRVNNPGLLVDSSPGPVNTVQYMLIKFS